MFVMLLLLSISLSLAFSEQTLELKLLSKKLFYFLETISLPIYLVHHPLRLIFQKEQFLINLDYTNKLFIYLGVSILIALIAYFIIEKIKKINLKKLFIEA